MRLSLKEYCENKNPWGSHQGKKTYEKLHAVVSATEDDSIEVSLGGIDSLDPSFFRESLVSLAWNLRGQKYFHISDVSNSDIKDNCSLGCLKHKMPLILVDKGLKSFIGPEISEPTQKLLDYVILKGEVTTPNLARDLKLSVQNASTRLKRLASEGYLVRKNEGSKTGGREYTYTVPA